MWKWREYKGEHFRKFALRLKKEHLWHRFIVLEYYFRFYTNPNNTTKMLIEFYKNENGDCYIPKEHLAYDQCRGTYFDGTNYDIKLSEFCKHYKI